MLMPMLGRLRVLLLEDASLRRDGLAALLALEAAEVIGALSASAHAVRLATTTRPDVAILDFAPSGAAQTVAALRDRWPATRVLVLSASEDVRFLDAALRAAVDGCLLWSDTRAELLSALRRVVEGHRYISRAIRHHVGGAGDGSRPAPAAAHGPSLLTEREREIMQCVASGLRTREIATRLSLSHKTVEKHRSNLMRKLGLRSAAAVAAYAISKGYGGA